MPITTAGTPEMNRTTQIKSLPRATKTKRSGGCFVFRRRVTTNFSAGISSSNRKTPLSNKKISLSNKRTNLSNKRTSLSNKRTSLSNKRTNLSSKKISLSHIITKVRTLAVQSPLELYLTFSLKYSAAEAIFNRKRNIKCFIIFSYKLKGGLSPLRTANG